MTAIVAIGLTSPVTQAAAPFVFGQPFKKGDVPAGRYLWIDTPNFSIVPLRHWNDGSVKHAMVIGRFGLSSNVQKQFNITHQASPAPVGTPLVLADIVAAAPTGATVFGSFGTVSLGTVLASPIRTYISTKEMVECHYSNVVGVDASLYAGFHVRLFADGRMRVRAVAANGYLNGTEAVSKTYIPTIVIGGATVFDNAGASYIHCRGSRYDGLGWINGDPQVTPIHDTGYLRRTKLLPNLPNLTPASSVLTYYAGMPDYTPGDNLGFTVSMGDTGFQPQIGLLTEWDALYLTTQANPIMYRNVIEHARAINSYSIAYSDKDTRLPIRIPDFTTWTFQGPFGGGGGPGSSKRKGVEGTDLIFEMAHFPECAYLAYLLTADYYFYETCAHVANLTYLGFSSLGGYGYNRESSSQNRARGWAYRSLGQAAAVWPESMASSFSPLSTWMAGLSAKKVTQLVDPGYPTAFIGLETLYQNRLYDYGTGSSSLVGGQPVAMTAPWEHDFCAMSLGHASDLEPCDISGMVSLNAFRDYSYGWQILRGGGTGPNEYNIGWAAEYTENFRIKESARFSPSVFPDGFDITNGGQMFFDSRGITNVTTNVMEGGSGSAPGGAHDYWAQYITALAFAKDHGKTGADAVWSRLTNLDNWSVQANAPYGDSPMFAVIPRSVGEAPYTFTAVDLGAPVPTPGPSIIMDSVSFLTTGIVMDTNRGLGILAANIPTGYAQPHPLLNDVDVGDLANTEYAYEVTTVPAGLTSFAINADGSFVATGPDGTHIGVQTTKKNGVFTTGIPLTITFGAATTLVSADLAATYAIGALAHADLSATYSIDSTTFVSADLAATYAIGALVFADLPANYSISTLVHADLAGSYAIERYADYARAPAGDGYHVRPTVTPDRPPASQGRER